MNRPWMIEAGVACVLSSGAVWFTSVLAGVPERLWADGGGYGDVGGLFAAFGVLMALLSLGTLARSPQAWLVLQLLSVIPAVAAVGGVSAIVTSWSSLSGSDRWLMALCVLTGSAQVVAVVMLNRRPARRWCHVDPEGYRTVFWK
jgi:hypothetical protein